MVVAEEAFGPIVPVMSWTTEDEVISRVNNTTTGLGGAVWSSDTDYAYALAKRIEAGTVWINSFEKPIPQAFFAGHKESGVGGEWGKAGLLSYCKAQSIHYVTIQALATRDKRQGLRCSEGLRRQEA